MTARKAPLPEVDDDACDDDTYDALSLRDVTALRACVTAADALRMWADLDDEHATAHAIAAYDAARAKVAT